MIFSGPRQLDDRRAFLLGTTLWLTSGPMTESALAHFRKADDDPSVTRIGLLTDLHYADKDPAGSRHYRLTLRKVAEAGRAFQKSKIHGLIQLGDLIDAADDPEQERQYLETIHQKLGEIHPTQHHVLGNHCLASLTKDQFLDTVQQPESYHSFDLQGFHFVILDACFRADGTAYDGGNFQWTDTNIPEKQLQWLQHDLQQTKLPTVVFCHQRLDVANHYGVKNAETVRKILQTGQVKAVFQGHSHKNDLIIHQQIPYITLVAMVEGSTEQENGYSVLSLLDNGSMKITGWRQQNGYHEHQGQWESQNPNQPETPSL